MNKRIQELASHCFDYMPDENSLRDFVSLIVCDCTRVLHAQLSEARFNEKVHLGLGDVRYTVGMESDYEDMLRKHFGVE